MRCVVDMKEILLSTVTGIVVGFIFALFRLPIPAPPVLAGVMGIFGIYIGVRLFQWISRWFF